MKKVLESIKKNIDGCQAELKKTLEIIKYAEKNSRENIPKNAGTKNYRKSQFEKVATVFSEFKTKVKFIKPDGETHWMDIEISEFEAIKKILLGKPARSHPVYRPKFPKGQVS